MQKADVYSFAIIVQEIIFRKGVFHISDEESWQPKGWQNNFSELIKVYVCLKLIQNKGSCMVKFNKLQNDT